MLGFSDDLDLSPQKFYSDNVVSKSFTNGYLELVKITLNEFELITFFLNIQNFAI